MAERLDAWVKRLEGLEQQLAREVGKAATELSLRAERNAKLLGTTRLRRRSGHLVGSIQGTARPSPDGGAVDAVVSAGGRGGVGTVKYARLQEMGGTVRPTRSTKLAIPLPAAQTAAGVSRYASPRHNPNLVLVRSRAGNLVLIDKHTGVPHYVLKDQVTITPHWYLRDGMKAAVEEMKPRVSEAVRKLLEGPA